MKDKTELQKLRVLRQNNQEANAITRECIESALILLMQTKRFEDITVTDITRKAGVSRTAYYRNYTSKEDILGGYMRNLSQVLSDVLKQFDAVTETRQSWIALLNAIKPYASQYKLLLDAGYFGKLIAEYANFMNEATKPGDYGRYYSSQYWSGAIFTVVSAWIRNGMDADIEQLADIGATLMTQGILAAEEYGNKCE
jgi:AcrR family transcriptional regulator